MDNNRYTEERYRQAMNSGIFGVILTVAINAGILFLCTFNGLKYIYPPPEEKSLVIDFEQEEAPVIKPRRIAGREPSAREVEPAKEVKYVQQSQAQLQGTKQNLAKASTVGPEGDVEVPEPPREEPIDNRSLFHAAQNTDKDTLAAQTAREITDVLKAGHASGNIENGAVEGAPSARVKGRTTIGVPTRPAYAVQSEGTVVVEIWVDQLGQVTRAVAGAEGTTVTDKQLWKAACQAALKTKFNQNPEAPGLQKGLITYIFKLK